MKDIYNDICSKGEYKYDECLNYVNKYYIFN